MDSGDYFTNQWAKMERIFFSKAEPGDEEMTVEQMADFVFDLYRKELQQECENAEQQPTTSDAPEDEKCKACGEFKKLADEDVVEEIMAKMNIGKLQLGPILIDRATQTDISRIEKPSQEEEAPLDVSSKKGSAKKRASKRSRTMKK